MSRSWETPGGRDYWLIVQTGIGSVKHRGPIEIDPSGALLLYRRGPSTELDLVAAYGSGMWVRVEAEVDNP